MTTTTSTRPTEGITRLTPAEIDQFLRQGYLGPYALRTPVEMEAIRARIESEVLTTPGPSSIPVKCRHLDQRLVHDLVADDAVLGRLRSLIGDDIVLWATFFFNKEPGGQEIPWHQDAHYWPIEPPINVSIWLAIDEVTTENSCVQIVPGSHRNVVPHVKSRPDMAFADEADPDAIDTSTAIDMELKPGEFFIFNERMLHHSNRNDSDRRRMGLSARYTMPMVKLLEQDQPPLYPGHTCVLVSGQDRFGLNRMSLPPTA